MSLPLHAPADALLCEVAWEVCQQMGGIYTVIRSKAPAALEWWGRRYLLVGPYDPQSSAAEFEEGSLTGPEGRVVQMLRDRGIEAHYGRWLVTGTPRVVLLNPASVFSRLGEIKYLFWEHHQIGLPDDHMINQVIAFGYLVEQFLRLLTQEERRPVIAHFHEWMAGSAIPELRRSNLPVSIVFTSFWEAVSITSTPPFPLMIVTYTLRPSRPMPMLFGWPLKGIRVITLKVLASTTLKVLSASELT